MHSSNVALVELLRRVPADRRSPIYKRHGVGPRADVEMLVDQICLDGSNAFMSMLRQWQGVPYAAIVRDVADQMGVTAPRGAEVQAIELNLVEELVRRYLKEASPEERERVQENLARTGEDHGGLRMGIAKGVLAAGTLGLLVKRIGEKAVAKIVSWIVLRTAARRAAGAAARRAAQVAGWAIPLLNMAVLGWIALDIVGPAYRKTVPTVLEVALLRLEYGGEESG